MTTKTSANQQIILAAGGLESVKSGLITYTWICKNCAMVACRRDYFSAKVPGSEPADCTTNVYYHNRRAVMCKASCNIIEKTMIKISVYQY